MTSSENSVNGWTETDQWIDNFLDELLQACLDRKAYSIIELADNKGVAYDQVKAWSSFNDERGDILERCRLLCACHTSDNLSDEQKQEFLDQ